MLRPMLLAVVVALAPMQCQGSDDPSMRRSESPGDALYDLAQQFREKGQQDAYKSTLMYLVDRYPGSRRAAAAQSELDELKAGVK